MYLNCLNCARTWAACKCDDWTREEALFRAERRDGIRDVDARLTPKGVAVYAEIDRLNAEPPGLSSDHPGRTGP